MSRPFDRFMLDLEIGRNLKVGRLTDSEFRAFVAGVLPVAAKSPVRGALLVGQIPATAEDVARQAGTTKRAAESAMRKLRDLGCLEMDDALGAEWVHDFEVYNPEPKADSTSAERSKRYRDKQRVKRRVTAASRRDATPEHGSVTPPEVRRGKNGYVNSPGTADASDRVGAAGRGTGSLSEDEVLAENVRVVLQNGIDGLTTNEDCKAPTRAAILKAIRDHRPSPLEAKAIATEVRSIAQSQNRAPNIAALYAQKLGQHVSTSRAAA